jgi:erythronate-4-phosphate dehydrogenase
MLNIIIDENIAFADEAFNHLGNVTLLSGRKITNEILKNADILIVRSVTKVDEPVLRNTSIKFIGTATIGTDHIDLDFLQKNNITFVDAKGCNAYSVAEYVISALLTLSVRYDFQLRDKSIGVIGVGNVGSKVAAFAEALGMNVLLNDPPLQRAGDRRNFTDLDEVLSADIITLHTPLNMHGIDKTFHLIDKNVLSRIKDGAILINSSRGAVINNNDLLDIINKKKLKVVLDVWENEPDIIPELLKQTLVGTPHIAGYSLEGKVNGTQIIYNSLCEFLGTQKKFSFNLTNPIDHLRKFNVSEKKEFGLNYLLKSIYDIEADDLRMRRMTKMNHSQIIVDFDLQRKQYPQRREFSNYSIHPENLSPDIKNILKALRFNIFN